MYKCYLLAGLRLLGGSPSIYSVSCWVSWTQDKDWHGFDWRRATVVCQAWAVLPWYSMPHWLPCSPEPKELGWFCSVFWTHHFECLTPNTIMQSKTVPRFYYTVSSLSPNRPSLYVCLAKKVLGQVPTMQCFARQQWLKAAKGLAMAAWFMVRCGVMAARRHAKSLQQRLSSSVRVALFTPARGLETLKHRKEERGSDCSTFRKRAKNLPRIE